jgi:hypothetical protein
LGAGYIVSGLYTVRYLTATPLRVLLVKQQVRYAFLRRTIIQNAFTSHANRQPPLPVGGKQIVAGKIGRRVFSGQDPGTAVQSLVNQPHRLPVSDMVDQQSPQDLMVNRGKKLDDIALKGITIAAYPIVGLVQSLVRSLTHPAGKAGADEACLPDWLDYPT